MITINVQQNNEEGTSEVEAIFRLTDATIIEAIDAFVKALELETFTDETIIRGLREASREMMYKDNAFS